MGSGGAFAPINIHIKLTNSWCKRKNRIEKIWLTRLKKQVNETWNIVKNIIIEPGGFGKEPLTYLFNFLLYLARWCSQVGSYQLDKCPHVIGSVDAYAISSSTDQRQHNHLLRRSTRRRHLPKIRTFKKIKNWIDRDWTDSQTDRQKDIVVHREVTLPKTRPPTLRWLKEITSVTSLYLLVIYQYKMFIIKLTICPCRRFGCGNFVSLCSWTF